MIKQYSSEGKLDDGHSWDVNGSRTIQFLFNRFDVIFVGLGGTCVNVGCIPKKLMHQAAILGMFFLRQFV